MLVHSWPVRTGSGENQNPMWGVTISGNSFILHTRMLASSLHISVMMTVYFFKLHKPISPRFKTKALRLVSLF